MARPRGAMRAHVDACVAPTWRKEVFELTSDGPKG